MRLPSGVTRRLYVDRNRAEDPIVVLEEEAAHYARRVLIEGPSVLRHEPNPAKRPRQMPGVWLETDVSMVLDTEDHMYVV